MEVSQIIILCVGLGLVGFILFFGRSKNKSESYQPLFEEGDQAPELTARVRLGEYLSGFPDFTGEASLVSCGITEDNFEFRKGMKGPKNRHNTPQRCKKYHCRKRRQKLLRFHLLDRCTRWQLQISSYF